ncbi:hypothetical protein, partial [Actinophytocola sediminis]
NAMTVSVGRGQTPVSRVGFWRNKNIDRAVSPPFSGDEQLHIFPKINPDVPTVIFQRLIPLSGVGAFRTPDNPPINNGVGVSVVVLRQGILHF